MPRGYRARACLGAEGNDPACDHTEVDCGCDHDEHMEDLVVTKDAGERVGLFGRVDRCSDDEQEAAQGKAANGYKAYRAGELPNGDHAEQASEDIDAGGQWLGGGDPRE